jgi:hypothetical protein
LPTDGWKDPAKRKFLLRISEAAFAEERILLRVMLTTIIDRSTGIAIMITRRDRALIER